jgi:predicted metal-binding transcription factor (methanogenesis marker protein 9)
VVQPSGTIIQPRRPPEAPRAPEERPEVMVQAPPQASIPREPPSGLDSKQLVEWHVARIHDHERLRTLSFYDTGEHIAALLKMRDQLRVRDIKELCSKVDLGMSHMTANKYLRVVRNFDRAAALRYGIEKCYALTVYAKRIGRPGAAAQIVENDEPIRGARGLRAKGASASKLYAAARALRELSRGGSEPTEIQAARERTVKQAQSFVRKLGLKGARAEIVRRGGEARVAIYISLETAERLEQVVPRAFVKLGRSLAKTKPDVFAPLREAGWRLSS